MPNIPTDVAAWRQVHHNRDLYTKERVQTAQNFPMLQGKVKITSYISDRGKLVAAALQVKTVDIGATRLDHSFPQRPLIFCRNKLGQERQASVVPTGNYASEDDSDASVYAIVPCYKYRWFAPPSIVSPVIHCIRFLSFSSLVTHSQRQNGCHQSFSPA